MVDENRQYEDLKIFAAKHCVDIFRRYKLDDFDDSPMIAQAWECGKAISNLKTFNGSKQKPLALMR